MCTPEVSLLPFFWEYQNASFFDTSFLFDATTLVSETPLYGDFRILNRLIRLRDNATCGTVVGFTEMNLTAGI